MKIKVGNRNKEMVLLFLVIASDVASSCVTLSILRISFGGHKGVFSCCLFLLVS